MKIIHIIVGLGDGGAEANLYKLVEADSTNEHLVVSLTGHGKYGPRLEQIGIPVFTLNWNFGTFIFRFHRLVSVVKMSNPEIIHCWMPHACLAGSIAARWSRNSRLFWGFRASDYGRGFRAWPTHLIVTILGLMSGYVPQKIFMVGARSLAQHLSFGFVAEKMVVITNGYGSPSGDSFGIVGKKARDLESKAKPMTVGMVARYDPMKDHQNLLNALALVANVMPDFSVILAGEGVDSANSELGKQISRLGLSRQVTLMGQVADPREIYEELDLHILSSSSEGFPNVVAESMLAGVPNVVTDVGDAAEIVGDTGWVVKPESAKALSCAILCAMRESPRELSEKRKRARIRIEANYSLDRMVSSYRAHYAARLLVVFSRYGNLGASSRVRMFQYFPELENAGWQIFCYPFADNQYLERLYGGRGTWQVTLAAFYRRIGDLYKARAADAVWVEKEFLPWVPQFLEFLFVRKLNRVAYDFDDAVYEHFSQHRNQLVRALLRHKVSKTLGRASLVIAGNRTLGDYCDRFSGGPTAVIPSVVDGRKIFPLKPADRSSPRRFVFGWIGTPITWRAYGQEKRPLFEALAKELDAEFWVVGAEDPGKENQHVKFFSWSLAQENSLLNALDVGLMPLEDDRWSRGKCGFKLLQYQAAGIPVIASPVGVNQEIVIDGVNGFLVHEEEDWGRYLRELSSKPDLANSMGERGRAQVLESYSLKSAAPRLIELFENLAHSQI